MEAKKICLVLGANGFVGSHIVDELAQSGHTVRAFDRYTNPPQFEPNRNIEVISGDINNMSDLERSLENVHYVIHCFSATTPYSSEDDPLGDIDKNLIPSIKIFNLCVKYEIKKIIFISSGGAIYGHISEEQPVTENDVPAPVSPYGIVKLAIEGYLAYFNRNYGIKFISYRLTNPYGPRQAFKNNQGVIPAFMSQIKENGRITVLGDGSALRDFIFIRDATKMIVNTFSKDTEESIYNIGSGTQSSIKDLIQSLQGIVKDSFAIDYKESPKTFLKNTDLSIDRFNSEFGVHKTLSLKQGLKKTF